MYLNWELWDGNLMSTYICKHMHIYAHWIYPRPSPALKYLMV